MNSTLTVVVEQEWADFFPAGYTAPPVTLEEWEDSDCCNCGEALNSKPFFARCCRAIFCIYCLGSMKRDVCPKCEVAPLECERTSRLPGLVEVWPVENGRPVLSDHAPWAPVMVTRSRNGRPIYELVHIFAQRSCWFRNINREWCGWPEEDEEEEEVLVGPDSEPSFEDCQTPPPYELVTMYDHVLPPPPAYRDVFHHDGFLSTRNCGEREIELLREYTADEAKKLEDAGWTDQAIDCYLHKHFAPRASDCIYSLIE